MAHTGTSPDRGSQIITTDFPLKKDAYLTFDALTMKQHIRDRLNEGGIFTDQNFEGSHIASIIDVIAYTFNAMMYYLTMSAPEATFSSAQLYENMNRIVKGLDYKPIGLQSSTLSFDMSAQNFAAGTYTIPRYSFISVNSIPYSFNEDITFVKAGSATEQLSDLADQKLLYQGRYIEYPLYTATGQDNEIIFLLPGDNVFIDHFNIDVYVKDASLGTWSQWERTTSLYLESALSKSFSIRLNENKNYEIKFGNDINGKRLNEGDQVSIYFLESRGHDGEINANELRGKSLIKYTTPQIDEILNDIAPPDQITFISDTNIKKMLFDNSSVSTFASEEESADDIRENAPGIFRSQYRLVTSSDYENYIKTNFANLIHDVKVANNWTYVSEVLKYYHDLGINDPNNVSRVLFNQVQFADACNFNNIYISVVPKTVSDSSQVTFLSPAQKELILSSMREQKTLTSEVVLFDPVFVAVTVALGKTLADTPILADVAQTEFVVIKSPSSKRDDGSIIADINNIFVEYFKRSNSSLGQTIDINQLTSDILNVGGLKSFFIRRADDHSINLSGLSLLVANPAYGSADAKFIFKNLVLPYFKFPYLYDSATFRNRIVVQLESQIFEGVEY